MAGFTRVQLREEVGRLFGMYEGTVSAYGIGIYPDNAPGYVTFYDYDLGVYANDYWNGADIFIKTVAGGGAPQGESSKVTDFASASGYLTISPTITAGLVAGSTYQLFQGVTKAQIDNALNSAAAGAEVATSLTPSTTTLDYQLAAATGLYRRQQVTGVWLRDMGEVKSMPYQINGWQLEDAEGLLTLRIPHLLNTNDQLWITYTMGENGMLTDASTVNLPMDLVRARAAVYLYQEKLGVQGASGMAVIGQRLRYWEETALTLEARYSRSTGHVRAFPWGNVFNHVDRASEALGISDLYTS